MLRDIYGLSDADFRARIGEFNRILELEEFWETRARQLSLGQRVRCDLAAALLHDPPVVFLDEPTIGMDVVVKEQVREFLRDQVHRRGRTVLLTTHDMTEVAKLAERVALIDHGRLVYDGKTAGLHDLAGVTWQVHVTVDGAPQTTDVPGMRMTRSEGDRRTFVPDQTSRPQPARRGTAADRAPAGDRHPGGRAGPRGRGARGVRCGSLTVPQAIIPNGGRLTRVRTALLPWRAARITPLTELTQAARAGAAAGHGGHPACADLLAVAGAVRGGAGQRRARRRPRRPPTPCSACCTSSSAPSTGGRTATRWCS